MAISLENFIKFQKVNDFKFLRILNLQISNDDAIDVKKVNRIFSVAKLTFFNNHKENK